MIIVVRDIKKSRTRRTRMKIRSISRRPRLSVFRSNKSIYGQIIDDAKGITLVWASSVSQKGDKKTKSELAKKVGQELAQKAQERGIKEVVFDRGRFKYHGRVKALAQSAREHGLVF